MIRYYSFLNLVFYIVTPRGIIGFYGPDNHPNVLTVGMMSEEDMGTEVDQATFMRLLAKSLAE